MTKLDLQHTKLELQHEFFSQLPELCLEWQAAPVPTPELVALNEGLVSQLGLDSEQLRSTDGVAVLAGNLVPEGAVPVALGYAGHQFGNYSPRLGDGRALLLGELKGPDGQLRDVHLKGSGRTPFARGGDGKATIGPMLREYIIAEALHALNVPTTRSLAVVATGEEIYRNRLEPGAVLTRVAASHIRVGTFEYAARLGGEDLVRRLADHAIARHHPHASEAENPYLEFLVSVVDVQAKLIADWMKVGFIHGVMNTDNMTISGEGIDYGPCAFMDRYDAETVFSSIDHGGRYAYGNQPRIAAWNLARLAEALLGLIGSNVDEAVELATDAVNSFSERFKMYWRESIAGKIGLQDLPVEDDLLFDDLFAVMQADRLDWTLTFRRLADDLRDSDRDGPGVDPSAEEHRAGQTPRVSDGLDAWISRWRSQLGREAPEPSVVAEEMDSVNPLYIPRNHVVHEALEAATNGDLDPFRTLAEVLSDPYTERPGLGRFEEPAPEDFNTGFRTFCGT